MFRVLFYKIANFFFPNKADPRRHSGGFASGKKGKRLIHGRCTFCGIVMDYPPILFPTTRPKPNQASAGTYKTYRTAACHVCAHEITRPGGDFDEELSRHKLDPELIWVKTDIDGETIVTLEKPTKDNMNKIYKPGDINVDSQQVSTDSHGMQKVPNR